MMSGELFKKGQIIPKRIGGLHVHRKARHRLVFGCDVLIDGNSVTAHYINMQADGTYIDYTLGWHWSGADYRFVRFVPFTEWPDITGSLSRLKAELCKPVAKWQKLLMVTDNELC